MLLAPAESIGICVTALKAGADAFYELRHRTIYEACVTLWDANKPVDLISVMQRLKDDGKLDGIGGLPYLALLPDQVPSAANLGYYLEILQEKFVRRRLLSSSLDIKDSSLDTKSQIMDLVAKASNAVQMVADAAVLNDGAHEMKTLVPVALDHIEELLKGGKIGMPTGFIDLDALTWGLHPAEMFVVAARPSVGKTSLAMNFAENIAMSGTPVGVFSMEMSKESLMLRMICSRAMINHQDIRKGTLTMEEQTKILSAASQLIKAKLFIDDTPGLSILELRARARRMAKQQGCKLFIIDYLQLMHAHVRKADNRQNEVTLISGGIKALAKELGVPVVVLSQLSRKMEDRGNNAEPKLSDLRESGSIEQDADVAVLLHRQKSDDGQTTAHSPTVIIKAIVAKNRNGPTGEALLTFQRFCTRFQNAASQFEDMPDEQKNLI